MKDGYDDWAFTECDYCGEDRKCYREDTDDNEKEPKYYCVGEDCKHLKYLYKTT